MTRGNGNNGAGQDGGSIYSNASAGSSLSIIDSTFSHNQTALANKQGGAISLYGQANLTVTNSTFNNNFGSAKGAAISIDLAKGNVLVENSTFSNNSNGEPWYTSGIGSKDHEGTLTVNNSTFFSNNAANLNALNIGNNKAAVTLNSNIFVSKILHWGSNIKPTGQNNITTEAVTLYGNSGGSSFTTLADFDSSNKQYSEAELKLKALGDNGGPTQTIALGNGSVAIKRGGSGSGSDQRGVTVSDARDIGAYESAAPTATGLVATINLIEDTAGNFDLSTLTIADADGGILSLTLEGNGTFTATSTPSVTVTGSTSNKLVFEGTAADLNTFLSNKLSIQYKAAQDFNGLEKVTASISDSSTPAVALADINVNISAVNDAPTLSSAEISISEGAKVTLSPANFIYQDIDSTDTQVSFNVTATNGQFIVNSVKNSTTFTLAQLKSGLVQFEHDGSETAPSFTVGIGDQEFTLKPILGSVNFTLGNDAPVIVTSPSGTTSEDSLQDTLTGLTVSDPDDLNTEYVALTNATPNSVSTDAGTVLTNVLMSLDKDGNFTLTADNFDSLAEGETATLKFNIQVTDGKDASESKEITLTVTGANDSAVANSVIHDLLVDSTSKEVIGQLSHTDIDTNHEDNVFQPEVISQTYGTLTISSNGSYNFTANEAVLSLPANSPVTEVFTVKTEDGTETTITINVSRAPVIDINSIVTPSLPSPILRLQNFVQEEIIEAIDTASSPEFLDFVNTQSSFNMTPSQFGDQLSSIKQSFANRPIENSEVAENEQGLEAEKDYYNLPSLSETELKFIESLLQEVQNFESSQEENESLDESTSSLPKFDFITEIEGQATIEELPEAISMDEIDERKSLEETLNGSFSVFA